LASTQHHHQCFILLMVEGHLAHDKPLLFIHSSVGGIFEVILLFAYYR
jgi:hypothetical protein